MAERRLQPRSLAKEFEGIEADRNLPQILLLNSNTQRVKKQVNKLSYKNKTDCCNYCHY
jgi:hypothetical protein